MTCYHRYLVSFLNFNGYICIGCLCRGFFCFNRMPQSHISSHTPQEVGDHELRNGAQESSATIPEPAQESSSATIPVPAHESSSATIPAPAHESSSATISAPAHESSSATIPAPAHESSSATTPAPTISPPLPRPTLVPEMFTSPVQENLASAESPYQEILISTASSSNLIEPFTNNFVQYDREDNASMSNISELSPVPESSRKLFH